MTANILIFICFITTVFAGGATVDSPASTDEMIDYINNLPGNTWTAARSDRFKNEEDIKKLLGARRETQKEKESRRFTINHPTSNEDLPEKFDARETWSKCETIKHIRDQAGCGSCWAFGAASAMSDRICIHSKETKTNTKISTTDLLACCWRCGFGCGGGFLGPAWDFWKKTGLVTGGDYNDASTCRPYVFEPCDHTGHSEKYPQCMGEYPTPECVRKCDEKSHLTYKKDRIRAKSSYNVANDAEQIQREIMTNGPVEAAFTVYLDFAYYTGGVYRHKFGGILGGHAIRIIGWGVEKNEKYWLIANSWNEEWGEEGLFKIVRGENHCGIEQDVVAGIPDL